MKFLFSVLMILNLSLPAYAQLVGDTTGAGDDCSAYPNGATTMVADSDLDGGGVILVCDGANWQLMSGGGGGALNDLSDVFHDPVTDFSNSNWDFFEDNDDDDNLFIGHTGATLLATPDPNKGYANTAIGATALDAITEGRANIAIGFNALTSGQTVREIVAIGVGAGRDLASNSYQNTFIGYNAAYLADQAYHATAVGHGAAYRTASFGLVAIGAGAFGNYDPPSDNTSQKHTVIGLNALRLADDGYRNTVIGAEAAGGFTVTGRVGTFDDNVFIGDEVGNDFDASTTPVRRNVFIGSRAGTTATSGNDSILIGYNVEKSSLTASNELNIGNVIYGSGLYGTGLIGINDPTPDVELDVVGDIHYTGVIQDVSDQRLKENIAPLERSLDRLVSLGGYSFTMKEDEAGVVEYGLLAQEVEQVFPELVTTGDDGFKTMNYVGMIAPLVEAVKAQQAQIEALEARIEELEQ